MRPAFRSVQRRSFAPVVATLLQVELKFGSGYRMVCFLGKFSSRPPQYRYRRDLGSNPERHTFFLIRHQHNFRHPRACIFHRSDTVAGPFVFLCWPRGQPKIAWRNLEIYGTVLHHFICDIYHVHLRISASNSREGTRRHGQQGYVVRHAVCGLDSCQSHGS